MAPAKKEIAVSRVGLESWLVPVKRPRQKGVVSASPSATGSRETSFLTQRRALVLLCLLQFVVIAVLSFWQIPNPPHAKPSHRTAYSLTNREPFFLGNPGPWGELEFARINIEPPDEFLPPTDRQLEPTRWFFEGQDAAQVKALLGGCELSPAQRTALANPAAWQVESDGVTLTPGADVILELAPQARLEIYRVLARSGRNEFHHWPYTYRSSGLLDWFGRSGLSATTLQWLNQLVYQRGDALCFSDLPEVHARITDNAERHRLIKTLFRSSALLMKLRIRPDTDNSTLLGYWGRGGRAKDFRPLLDSLTQVEGSIALDIAHLLPPFARKRLNTFPSPPASPDQPTADCFWTSMNFFNDPPDDRYHDEKVWSRELEEKYAIAELPAFGDLVFLLQPDGTPVHAAVYIADNVLFTKNGGHLRQPWLLMKLEDMLARYPVEQGVRVVCFRLK